MTYIELINSFWESTKLNPYTSGQTTFYLYLLHQCNIRRWSNPFEIKTRNFEIMLGLSRSSIKTIRTELKNRGLIDYRNGVGSGSAAYYICGVKVTNAELYNKICVQSENTMVNTNKICVQSENTMVNTMVNTNEKNTLYIEEKRNKTIYNTPPISPSDKPSVSGELSGGVLDLKFKKKPKIPIQVKEPSYPSLEEVKSYFLSQGADTRIDDWEREAEIFFYNFNATDWIDAAGRKVKQWDSRANRWILKREEEKIKRTNGKFGTQKQIPSDRRGTEADSKGRKEWGSSF